MGDLGEGVHAGVRATRAVEPQRLFGDFCKGSLDEILDGVPARLGLPTAVGTAVVSDGEFQTHKKGVLVK